MTKIAFSGRFRAGKDYVANACGLSIIGFADPIYSLCRYFLGTDDKAVPGIRAAMQYIGQVGWGCVSEAYPLTVERAMWVEKVRNEGHLATRDDSRFKHIDWAKYGTAQQFWVDILLGRMDLIDGTYDKTGVGVVNARFSHELDPLTANDFELYHVFCSEETRRERIEHYDPATDTDSSEQMAIRFCKELPDSQIVWNDHRPQPEGHKYWTVEDFAQHIKGKRLTAVQA